ncbi:MAG TPA: ACT domain-containing protein [Polyangiaceae bacterium]|nr:ACT domain-containing protein [Polyangiaceae bacterium]
MTDECYLVLSALGPDRPGLVAEVTAYLTECGANIEDSRMAVLGAEFGILVLVSGSEAALARVLSGVAGLEAKTELAVVTRPTKSPEEHRRATVSPCVIRAEAIDREGIVRAIAGVIHDIGVNIVSLETETYPAPVTGSPLFRLAARVDVPAGLTLARVRAALEAVAQRENVDVDVRSGAGLARRSPVRLAGPGQGVISQRLRPRWRRRTPRSARARAMPRPIVIRARARTARPGARRPGDGIYCDVSAPS